MKVSVYAFLLVAFVAFSSLPHVASSTSTPTKNDGGGDDGQEEQSISAKEVMEAGEAPEHQPRLLAFTCGNSNNNKLTPACKVSKKYNGYAEIESSVSSS
jgi:hypothetical protein